MLCWFTSCVSLPLYMKNKFSIFLFLTSKRQHPELHKLNNSKKYLKMIIHCHWMFILWPVVHKWNMIKIPKMRIHRHWTFILCPVVHKWNMSQMMFHIWAFNTAVQTQHVVGVLLILNIHYVNSNWLYKEVYWTRRLIVLLLLIVLIDSILNPENLVH